MHNWERLAIADPSLCTYQLHIDVAQSRQLTIGRFGSFHFPAGRYIYTGSARRNLIPRVRRHLSWDNLSGNKKRHWHIDYLLSAQGVRVVAGGGGCAVSRC